MLHADLPVGPLAGKPSDTRVLQQSFVAVTLALIDVNPASLFAAVALVDARGAKENYSEMNFSYLDTDFAQLMNQIIKVPKRFDFFVVID